MAFDELDSVDKGILYLLQRNARSHTTAEIGEKVGVSSSTVGNRINQLEERGVITGYYPTVDYDRAGLGHHLQVVATVPFEEQESLVDEVMEVSGVVSVRELLTNTENVSIELVGYDKKGIEQSLRRLNDIGIDIERMEMVRSERTRPYNHFGEQFTSDGGSG